MSSTSESLDTSRPDPNAMPGAGIDLARLREHVEGLLEQAVTNAALVTVETPSGTEDGGLDDGDTAAPHDEELVEVTAEQLDALNAAHDALADALASLDSGRK